MATTLKLMLAVANSWAVFMKPFLAVTGAEEVISVISYQLSVISEPPTEVGGLKY